MRFALVVAVLLAVVSTAVVAVCQHSETRRMQHRVWELERRRMHLERQAQRLESAIEAGRTPRRLLVENDRRRPDASDPAVPVRDPEAPARTPAPAETIRLPAGFVTGGNFEGEGR